jgi:hypothetical protein
MRKPFFPPFAALCLAGCFQTSTGPVPFDTTKADFGFPVGQTRLLLREVIRQVKSEGVRKTWPTVGWYRVVKDTAYEGFPAKIVEGRSWERIADTLFPYASRELFVFEDSQVSVYQFNPSYGGFLVDLLKPSAPPDTAIFSDRVTALRYPLTVGRPWHTRLPTDPNAFFDLQKGFMGTDTLAFKGKRYVCGVFGAQTLSDSTLRTWVSRIGLMKAELDFGPAPLTDTAGDTVMDAAGHVDTVLSAESYTLLDLDVDSTAALRYLERYDSVPVVSAGSGARVER